MDALIATLWSDGLSDDSYPTLQEKLHATIRKGILSGALGKGVRLPATRALSKRLGLARNTVIEAYDKMVAEGYLETRRGAGTFVAATTPDGLLTIDQPPPKLSRVTQSSALYDSRRHRKPLFAGMAALDQFPTTVWARVSAKATRGLDKSLMYYSDPMGYMPLRKSIADYLAASRSVVASASQIMITSGLQQGLFLVARGLLGRDDKIFLEDPGYWGLYASARQTGRNTAFVSVDKHGTLTPPSGRGLLITCPSRQFPLGQTMPHTRRLQLLEWAQQTQSLIFEDDYDSEFRYAGRPLNSLQGIDQGQRVIYGGTFSKSMFPALRLGYLVLPDQWVEPISELRRAIDSYPSITNQLALNAFIETGEFTRHIRRLRKTHGERQSAFTEAAKVHLGKFFSLDSSDTGLHVIARPTAWLLKGKPTHAGEPLGDPIDARWAEIARSCGMGAVHLSASYRELAPEYGLLMSFANIGTERADTVLAEFAHKLSLETHF